MSAGILATAGPLPGTAVIPALQSLDPASEIAEMVYGCPAHNRDVIPHQVVEVRLIVLNINVCMRLWPVRVVHACIMLCLKSLCALVGTSSCMFAMRLCE